MNRNCLIAPGFLVIALAQPGCEVLEDKPKTVGDFCSEYAQRECEPTAPLCSRDRAECEPIRRAECEKFVAPLMTTGRVFRRDNAEACLEQLTATYKKNVITATDLDALGDKCSRVVEGAGQMNATCSVDQDCRSPFICDKSKCGPLRVVAAGANCANPGEVCQPNEFCRPGDGIAVCSARADRASSCRVDLPCRPNLRCGDAICVDKLGLNAACATDDECASGYCNRYPPSGMGPTCLPGLIFAPFAPTCEAYFGHSATPDAGSGVRRTR
jgi:hypothetical protein